MSVVFNTPLFASLAPEDRLQFAAQMTERVYLPGDTIVQEGDPATAVFVILDGDVQVWTETDTGQPLILNRMATGATFGEQALLPGADGRRTATVRAHARTRLAVIPAELFQSYLRTQGALEVSLQEQSRSRLERQARLQTELLQHFAAELDTPEYHRTFAPGTRLLKRGAAPTELFLLLDGEVEVWDDRSGERRILNRVGPGHSIGELGIMEGTPRTAHVDAITTVEALCIPAARFRELYQQEPALGAALARQRRFYTMADGSSLAQYRARFDHQPALTSVYTLPGGRTVVVSRLEDGSASHVERRPKDWDPSAARRLEYRGPDGGLDFELQVVDGPDGCAEPVGLSTFRDVEQNAALLQLFLQQRTLRPDEEVQLVATGTVPAPGPPAPSILCRCVGVAEAEVRTAMATGCRDLPTIQARTGCGTVCGGCRGRVQDLLEAENRFRARIASIHPESDRVASFRLVPVDGPVPAFSAGQHIEVQAELHGRFVVRPYTIASSATDRQGYTLTIRREPGGLLSEWLFQRTVGDELWLSPPRGTGPLLHPDRPLVCFVAGIGITPALSVCRTIRDAPGRGKAFIHHSVSTPEAGIAPDALQPTPGVAVRRRVTAEEGRIDRDEVRAIATAHPGAMFLLCGPEGYLADVSAHLAAVGIPAKQLHIERFHAAGAPIPTAPPAPEPPRSSALRVLGHVGGGLQGMARALLLFAPLFCVASAVLLPLFVGLGWVGTEATVIWAALTALAFAWDLFDAHREWREFFFVELPDDEVIDATALRPPLFKQSATDRRPGRLSDETPTRMLMRRLRFRAWLHYKYTLRFDYILNDIWRLGVHLMRQRALQAGHTGARRWAPLYAPFWEEPDRQVAELILETTLCMGITACRTDPGTGHRVATFTFSDWHCPAGPHLANEVLVVDRFEVEVDLQERRAVAAHLNGEPINTGRDALTIAFMAVSFYYHTVLHAFANWACVPNHPDPVLSNAATYTMAMNGQAWYAGIVCQQDPLQMRRALTYNATRGFHRHGTGSLHRELVQHSRASAFYMQARQVVLDVLTEHRIEIDPEAFFLMSVLHSVDHHYIAACTDPTDLHTPLLGSYRGGEWTRVLFVRPLTPIFANTRLSNARTPWARDLYQRLQAVDPHYADLVDTCIRY